MSVYVDRVMLSFGRMKMSHMVADTDSELHAMAVLIGLKRAWFQGISSTPHYDVSISKRALAIEHGAIELDSLKMVELIRKMKARTQ